MDETKHDAPQPMTDAELAARGRRNVWLGLALAAFVVIVLAVTVVRISQGSAAMPDGGF